MGGRDCSWPRRSDHRRRTLGRPRRFSAKMSESDRAEIAIIGEIRGHSEINSRRLSSDERKRSHLIGSGQYRFSEVDLACQKSRCDAAVDEDVGTRHEICRRAEKKVHHGRDVVGGPRSLGS